MLRFEVKCVKIGWSGGACNTPDRDQQPIRGRCGNKKYSILKPHPASILGGVFVSNQLKFTLSGNAPETPPLQLAFDRSSAKPGKVCSICHVYKPYSHFSKSKLMRDGRVSACAECLKEYRDKSGLNAKHAARMRKLYNESEAHRDAKIITTRTNWAIKRGIPGRFTVEEWQALKAEYDFRCAYCGYKAPILTIDHFWPLKWYALGFTKATNTIANIVPACEFCNYAKQDVSPFIFLAWKNGLLQEL